MVGDGSPQSCLGHIWETAVQEVAIEDHGRAGGEFDGYRLALVVREMVSLRSAVEPGVVDLAFGVDNSVPVRPRYDP